MANKRINFTRTILDNIPKKDFGTIYYDTTNPKLTLFISNKGKRSFKIAAKINGKFKKRKIGEYPHMTISIARQRANKIYGQLLDDKIFMRLKRKTQPLENFLFFTESIL